MPSRRLASHSPAWVLGVCLAIALGGCATNDRPSTRNDPAAGVPAVTEAVGGASDAPIVEAAATPVSNPAPARFALPGSGGNNALGSVVVTNPLAPRTVDLTKRPDDIWDRVRTGFAIPNINTPLVAEQQAWFLSHPDYLRRAVDRSSLYLYHVVQELNNRGMPTELALLPFVESAYNPMAYSRAKASGMWQFIPGTGKSYNLKQDWWRDERRDVLASTDAALTYLKAIYDMHGDWHLALASYNWGEGSVKRAIERNQAAGLPTDYLSLSMPDETRNYVPKLQALKNIIANPAAFGVTLPKIDNEPYFVAVERSRDIDVRTAARLANMSLEDFRALNPSSNRPVIRASGTPLLIPATSEMDFRNGMASGAPLATWQAHTVTRRETVESIAARYGMTAASLREANGLGGKGRVRVGQGLLVQKKGPADANLQFASFNPPTDGGVLLTTAIQTAPVHVVRKGDTLASIARSSGVPVARLRAINHLKGTSVAVGMRLQIAAPVSLHRVSAPSAVSLHRASSAAAAPRVKGLRASVPKAKSSKRR